MEFLVWYVLLLLAGAIATTTGEFVREGARKPYRIENYLIAPGVLPSEVLKLQRDGFITHSRWHQADPSAVDAGVDPGR